VFPGGHWWTSHSLFPVSANELTFTKFCVPVGSNSNNMGQKIVTGNEQTFQHSGSLLNILRARRVTQSMFHTEVAQTDGDRMVTQSMFHTKAAQTDGATILHSDLACGFLFTPYWCNSLIGHDQQWLVHIIVMYDETVLLKPLLQVTAFWLQLGCSLLNLFDIWYCGRVVTNWHSSPTLHWGRTEWWQ
jgi:hypothetical protein